MTEIPVEQGQQVEPGVSVGAQEVIEKEITKRTLIESVTSVVLVVLYMMFSFLRDKEPGVVPLDGGQDAP